MPVPVYAIASNIITALGLDTERHWRAVLTGKSGITLHNDKSFSGKPFFASKLDASQWQHIQSQQRTPQFVTPFESLAAYSALSALRTSAQEIDLSETAFILSTTKGNIELLGQVPDEKLLLTTSARIIAKQIGISAKPIIVSHACVSGVVSLLYGLRLIQSGRYKNVIVTGCDRFSRFVLSGFQSFLAISDEPCRPFDVDRKGITLGEAAATIILSSEAETPLAQLSSVASSNDANHISGPSRTGEELSLAIDRALQQAGIAGEHINAISAHGTATIYNDEMESKAFALSGLLGSDVHSFKSYIGHTLGAAGVVESAMLIESLRRQQVIPSLGYEKSGVSALLRVTQQLRDSPINYALKTASGFGGCNAAAIWKQV